MSDYKPIPIEAAKRIAEEFDKDQVIIVTWDNVDEMMHVATYGKNKVDSINPWFVEGMRLLQQVISEAEQKDKSS